MTTATNIVTNALYEMGKYSPGEVPSAEHLDFGLTKLNRLLDTWNSKKIYIYSMQFLQFNQPANKSPLTIGKAFKVVSVSLTSNVATIVGVPSRPFFAVGDLLTSLNIPVDSGLFNLTAQAVQSVSTDGTTLTFNVTGADFTATATSGVVIPASTPPDQAPDFPVPTSRPTKIVNGNQILNEGGQIVRVPMRIVDADWWANQRTPYIGTDLPTHVYYQPSFPNGQLFTWPVCQVVQPIELEVWNNLSQLEATDTFEMPPGYEDAVTYTLAESLCPTFGKPVDPALAAFGTAARSAVMGPNTAALLITTADFGLPGVGDQRGRADFNWKTGNLTG